MSTRLPTRRPNQLLLVLAVLALAAQPGSADDEPATGEASQAAAPAAAREPITNIGGSAPAETPQQRLERFRLERGAGSDKPFEGFATHAEQEMAQRRQAAIAGGRADEEQAEDAAESRVLTSEKLQDQLAELGAWGGSMCTEVEPAWSLQENFITHRKLRLEDFQSELGQGAAAAASSKLAPTGFAAILFSCELEPLVQKVREDLFVARIVRVRYYTVLSRKASWLVEHPPSAESFLIGHQQLHFDMANAFAGWLNQNRDATLAGIQAVGASPELAISRLRLRWGQHMLTVYSDFDALETKFDRETKHGSATEKQTEWTFRVRDGFEALAKGLKLESRPKRAKKGGRPVAS